MAIRFLSAILILASLAGLGSGSIRAQSEPCETRECKFEAFNPPVLRVSECIDLSCLEKKISVSTNCTTLVCIECTDFIRYERDCEGGVLRTYDTIEARCVVRFCEAPVCKEGGEFRWKSLGKDCWCLESHRGGWFLILSCAPYGAELCDDCGCYEARCRIRICTVPTEEECCVVTPEPPGPEPKLKGNNGVGNGLDPQPPGNPPINDGPGTAPGSPGNQGGAN
jgi:hypothetical protein